MSAKVCCAPEFMRLTVHSYSLPHLPKPQAVGLRGPLSPSLPAAVLKASHTPNSKLKAVVEMLGTPCSAKLPS